MMRNDLKPKYSVVIITYNQENILSRAIESILCQKELVYELIISDDCSTDSTWDVVNCYYEKYPNLIKPYRNSINLGIFDHIESTWAKISGDIVFYLAGDDVLCDGLFVNANKVIEKQNIDYINDSFTIYFDFKQVTPTGQEIIFRNNKIIKYDPISLKIRNLIYNRTTGVSSAVIKKHKPVNKKIGIYADGLIDIQTQQYSQNNYYCPFIGSVYYSGIGISSSTKLKVSYQSYQLYVRELFGIIDTSYDNNKNWLKYLDYKFTFLLQPNCMNYIRYFIYMIKSANFRFGIYYYYKEIKGVLKNAFKIKLF